MGNKFSCRIIIVNTFDLSINAHIDDRLFSKDPAKLFQHNSFDRINANTFGFALPCHLFPNKLDEIVEIFYFFGPGGSMLWLRGG